MTPHRKLDAARGVVIGVALALASWILLALIVAALIVAWRWR